MTQQVGSRGSSASSTSAPAKASGATSKEWVRQEWIDATHFHDLTEDEVLREVARRVADVRAQAAGQHRQAHPLVLLDLDSTLYEVGPRTHQILREWLATEESRAFPKVCQALETLGRMQVGYSLADTFEAVGLSLDDAETARAERLAKKFWAARFFQSDYLKYDHAYDGAARFAQELHRLGAEIVYLTGRDEPGMGDGTRARLKQDGFPWELDRTHLLMKAAPELDDLEHKLAAGTYVRAHGTLVASFENEPPNLVALYDQFPEAMHVFVDTVCSDRPALAGRDLYRIKGFGFHAGE